MKELELNAEQLREKLVYDAETGVFTWRVKPSKNKPAGMVAGYTRPDRRVVIIIRRRLYYAHRLAWLYTHGRWPLNAVDHINCDPLDNRIANLREASHAENMQNRRKARSDSSSGLAGAYQRRDDLTWYAEIRTNRVKRYIGAFATKEEAHEAFLNAKRIAHAFCTV